MEHIVLSLLLIKSMTIYEMRGFISQNLTSVCSDSMGSIQAAIKKLLSKNDICYREYTDKGLNKKEYSITDSGLEKFMRWIQIPMNIQKVKSMEDGKFFFLGMAPKQVRVKVVKNYIDSLVQEMEKLLQIQRIIEAMKENVIEWNVDRISKDKELHRHLLEVTKEECLEDAILNIYRYQIYSLEYGLERLQYDISFYEKIVRREEEEGN